MNAGIACPHCGTDNTAHAGLRGHDGPGDGDYAICASCRGLAVYVTGPFGLSQRRASTAEREAALADPDVAAAMAMLTAGRGPQATARAMRGISDAEVTAVMSSVRAEPHRLEELSCGCAIGGVGDAFVIRPCTIGCPVAVYALRQARAGGKPVAYGWEGNPN